MVKRRIDILGKKVWQKLLKRLNECVKFLQQKIAASIKWTWQRIRSKQFMINDRQMAPILSNKQKSHKLNWSNLRLVVCTDQLSAESDNIYWFKNVTIENYFDIPLA